MTTKNAWGAIHNVASEKGISVKLSDYEVNIGKYRALAS